MDTRWLEGLEESAHRVLPAPVFRYFQQGSGEGISAAEAAAAWRSMRLLPRVLRDVGSVDLRTRVLGRDLAVPFGVAPTTLQRAAHPDGERAMATAVAARGSLMVVSSNAGTPFEEIAATGVHWWLQAYVPQERSLIEPVLARAVNSGASAVVLTVDTPTVGTKYGDGPSVWESVDPSMLRVNFANGDDPSAIAEKATDLGVDDISRIADFSGLPVVVKGVLHPADAATCVAAGASAIWVSNHGGRQLDRVASTASAIAAVAHAVHTSVDAGAQVYVDGGVRSGLDILTALALGADCVFLGRLPLWALVAGPDAVIDMYDTLAAQLSEAMGLAGVGTPSEAPQIAVSGRR